MIGARDLPPMPRRGLRREAAAAYVGVGTSKFDEWVADGRMPQPKRIDGCVIWDVRALDLAFDALPNNADAEVNTWAGV